MTKEKIGTVLSSTLDSVTDILVEWRKLPDHGITADQKIKMDERLNAVVHDLKDAVKDIPEGLEEVKDKAIGETGVPTLDLQVDAGEIQKEEIKEPVIAGDDLEEKVVVKTAAQIKKEEKAAKVAAGNK